MVIPSIDRIYGNSFDKLNEADDDRNNSSETLIYLSVFIQLSEYLRNANKSMISPFDMIALAKLCTLENL